MKARLTIFAVGLLCLTMFLFSCSSGGGSGGGGGNPVSTPTATITSLDNISTAETTSVIDHDTALLYTLYMAFDPSSLPTEYRGNDSDVMIGGTTEILQLAGRFDLLPADLQAKVQPFLLRPDDPLSVWNKRLNELLPASTSLAPSSRAKRAGYGYAPITWLSVDSASTPVRVWYPENYDWSTMTKSDAQVIAEKLALEIDASGMWNLEKSAMLGTEPCGDGQTGGGSNRLDVYIVPSGMGLNWNTRVQDPLNSRTQGLTVGPFSSGCGFAPFIMINGSIGSAKFDMVKATMAHELFHAFQYHLGMSNGSPPDSDWWAESSATWAEDLVYPALNTEQSYLRQSNNHWSFTTTALGPLDYFAVNSQAPYAAYLWPFFLSHRAGGSTTNIGELWKKSASMAPIQAMANLPDWPDAFKEFARWNWNKKPVEKYNDLGGGTIIPLGQVSDDFVYDAGLDAYIGAISLDKTSITYVEMKNPPATSVKQLEFDQSALASLTGWGLQAIINDDRVEDWSYTPKRTFCLAREPVTRIILVASNSNIVTAGLIEGTLKMKKIPVPCSGTWSGPFSYTNAYHNIYSNSTETAVWSGTVIWGNPVIENGATVYSLDYVSTTVTKDGASPGVTTHGSKTVLLADFSASLSRLTVFPDGSYTAMLTASTTMTIDYTYDDPKYNGSAVGPISLDWLTQSAGGTIVQLINNRMQGDFVSDQNPMYTSHTIWDFGYAP